MANNAASGDPFAWRLFRFCRFWLQDVAEYRKEGNDQTSNQKANKKLLHGNPPNRYRPQSIDHRMSLFANP